MSNSNHNPESGPDSRPEALLRRLEWTVIKRLDGLLAGDYRTLFRGAGLDLADVREYQPHDDVRYIDWTITARMQVPYVREYNVDREITAWFLLDMSPSIDFGAYQTSKRAMLIQFVSVMARLLTRNGNRVGVMFYGSELDQMIPARSGRNHVLHIIKALNARPRMPRAVETNLEDFFRSAFNIMKRRGMVFALSDFLSAPGWEQVLGHIGQRHETVAIRLYDPLETEMPDIGMVMMEDAETGEQLLVDTHDAGLRRRFMALAEAREEHMLEAFAAAGVDALELSTTDDMVETLLRFAELRGRRIRLGRDNGARDGGARDGGARDGSHSRLAALQGKAEHDVSLA
jgi:uncharacterized protein (DUF58 family)